MSLAAALASEGVRPASFLPSIKCSDCGKEIEISDIGSHVCGKSDSPPPSSKSRKISMSNPFTLRKLNAGGQPANAPSPLQQDSSVIAPSPVSSKSASKASRSQPPRINPEAANRPFLAPIQRHQPSPLSPAASIRSGSSNDSRPTFTRSATSPAPRLYDPRPPSLELSANLDCAFPPFPTPTSSGRRPSAPTISSSRKTPTGSDRAPSRGGSRLDHVQNASPAPSELKSPNTRGGENVLKRMKSLRNGPFAFNRRQVSGDTKGELVIEKTRPIGPTLDEPSNLPTIANSNHSESRRLSNPAEGSETRQPPARPERPPSQDVFSPAFLSQLNLEPLPIEPLPLDDLEQIRPVDRSKTFPWQDSEEHPPSPQTRSRMRSEPAMRETNPQESASEQSKIPQIQFLEMDESKDGPRLDHRIHDAPPVPKAIEQYRHDSSHTPTDSGSSISSATHSTPLTDRSGTSSGGSVASSMDTFSSRNFDHDEDMMVKGLSVRGQQRPDLRAEQPGQRSPPRNKARTELPLETPQKPEEIAQTPLESPMDPALLGMQRAVGPAYEPWQATSPPSRPKLSRTQTSPESVSAENFPYPPALSIPKQPDLEHSAFIRSAPPRETTRPRAPSAATSRYSSYSANSTRPAVPDTLRPPPTPQDQCKKPPSRRGTNAKPVCRGCNHTIDGKSVKAADGRLTGRWHKACFVCKSCQQPFVTADFYVINNEPYCEQHYHEENGSLCHGCHRGIEGQYLETSSSTRYGSVDRKYHPRCFTCCQCRTVLAQDYFEMRGAVYCERHALATMRAQNRLAHGLNPQADRRGLMAERRTTRLINPMMA
ncbi:Paxillin 1 [Lecanosticta acicola]|uniref:Paxillin 1 n=1 Tax=Lecanosticta acicola TaxID=111012 RepID=A0AAI8YUG9_9PEZI|nr:Paxillin 1 [Lecanosticta acicola]